MIDLVRDDALLLGLPRRLLDERLGAGVPPVRAARAVEAFTRWLAGPDGPEQAAYSVERAGTRVGTAVTVRTGPDNLLLASLEAPVEWRTGALTAARVLAADGGADRLSFSALPGAWDLREAAAALGAVLEATTMQLDLSAPGAEPVAAVAPLSSREYAAFRASSGDGYAEELLAAGVCADLAAARAMADAELEVLLPPGGRDDMLVVRTPPHGEPDGWLWIHVDADWAYVYDIRVRSERRRQGLGTALMNSAAGLARARGARVLGLNVFGPNTGARRLYERLGYRTTERLFHLPTSIPE